MVDFEVEEIELNLTYGRIAGKWWGSREKKPILMVHGWQDSAGSFDTLIPLLPREFSYLAIDLPGHGFSSHLPKGCYYHSIDLVPLLEEIRVKLKWDRLSLISHSMGAIVSFFYAAVFPDRVDLVVALDTLKMQHHPPKFTERIYTWRMTQLINLIGNLREEPPEYTYDELVRRVREGSMFSVDLDKTKYMIERGSRPSPNNPNKFYFTRDIRVKFMSPYYVDQSIGLEYIKKVKAAYLFIKADDRDFSEPDKNLREATDLFRRVNKNFEMLRVKGTHHVHLNQPELMAGTISKFLRKHHIQQTQPNIEAALKCKL